MIHTFPEMTFLSLYIAKNVKISIESQYPTRSLIPPTNLVCISQLFPYLYKRKQMYRL